MLNATYYPNLEVGTAVSFPQQIAWGVRKNAPLLLDTLNSWILEMRKHPDYYTVYNKYYKSSKSSRRRKRSEYSTIGGGKLSPYDSLIKVCADTLGWDWRLLAAQVYKESKFDAEAISWAGAIGLMQLLPGTGEEYGVSDLTDPQENIEAGTRHLMWLDDLWDDMIDDPEERLKFVLASYNVGHGHVRDARNLTQKYAGNPNSWDEVAEYLIKKSNPAYFNDPVVEFGYCRGIEPVNYVEVILETYETYMAMFPETVTQSSDQQS